MNSFRLHFPDCEKVNRLSLFQIGPNITFFVSERKMVAKVEQRGETGGVRRNEEVET